MSNKNNIQSLQQKQPGNTQILLGITKKNEKGFKAYTVQNPNRAGTSKKRERHLNTILIVGGNQQYPVITDIKRAFTKVFPIEK